MSGMLTEALDREVKLTKQLREDLRVANYNLSRMIGQRDEARRAGERMLAQVNELEEELDQVTRSRDGWKADAERESINAADKAAELLRIRTAIAGPHYATLRMSLGL